MMQSCLGAFRWLGTHSPCAVAYDSPSDPSMGRLPEVVIRFPTIWGSGVSWWRVDGAPLEWAMPFPSKNLVEMWGLMDGSEHSKHMFLWWGGHLGGIRFYAFYVDCSLM